MAWETFKNYSSLCKVFSLKPKFFFQTRINFSSDSTKTWQQRESIIIFPKSFSPKIDSTRLRVQVIKAACKQFRFLHERKEDFAMKNERATSAHSEKQEEKSKKLSQFLDVEEHKKCILPKTKTFTKKRSKHFRAGKFPNVQLFASLMLLIWNVTASVPKPIAFLPHSRHIVSATLRKRAQIERKTTTTAAKKNCSLLSLLHFFFWILRFRSGYWEMTTKRMEILHDLGK